MVRWKKEKVSRVSRWSLSHNEALGEAGGGRSEEEGARFWPMLTTPTSASLTNRKRARLDGKVVDDCDAVDPSPVPRKLRSAINKCSSQSSSPAIPGAKKKPYDTFNGLQVLHGNGGRRCKQNVLLGSLTEDEKEVLEALCALSRILPIKERIQDDKDREISENHQDNIATPTTHSEAMKEDKNLLQQNTTNGIKSPSFCLEKTLEKPMKDEHAISKQPDTNSGMQTIDSGLSIAPDSGSHITPLSENVHPENIPGNLQSFLSPSGVLPRHCTENRTLQPTQCGSIIAFPPCKSEMLQPNGCVGSAALKHEVQYLKHNSESSTKLVYQKGNVPPHIQLSSSNSAVWPGPATSITSKEVNLPTMKVPLDVTPLWKKCAVHVFISHMIKSYQEKEQQHTLILPSEDSKSRVGSESCELVNNERAGLQSRLKIVASAAIYGSTVERSKHAGTNEISCNRRLVSAHISSVLSEYRQKQSCDFLSLSTNGDAGSTANGVKAPVQLHSPFFHAQVPFPVSHVPYVPAYPEKLVAPATQQVQPQLQHYAGNPFYGPQMNNTIGNSQQQHQQQQICQAHIARYRSPVGIAVLQNDQIHNSLSPSTQLQGFSSLSSKPKPQQQHHHHQLSLHGRRQHKDPHQFQLLYSTSRS